MEISYGCLSKPGDRQINEDSIAHDEKGGGYIFVLADGLGGHGKGDIASRLAVDAAVHIFKTEKSIQDALIMSFEHGQKLLLDKQKKERCVFEMKTTMVVLILNGNEASWGHIGDSRLYYFKKNKLDKRTMDHSVPQMLKAIGEIKEKDIRHHEDRNKLLRVMGAEWGNSSYEVTESPVSLEKGDAFLLCSDGFWEWIDEKNMVRLMKKAGSPEHWLSEMEKQVVANGAKSNMDNYSAIAVFVR